MPTKPRLSVPIGSLFVRNIEHYPSLQAERLSALSRNPVHFKGEFAKSNHAVRARGRPQMSKLFTSLLGSQSDQASFKINMHNKHSTGLEQSRGGEGELSKLLTSLYANQSNHSILGTLQNHLNRLRFQAWLKSKMAANFPICQGHQTSIKAAKKLGQFL